MPEEKSVKCDERACAVDSERPSDALMPGETGPNPAAAAIDFSRAARLDSSSLHVLLALDFALKRSGGGSRAHALDEDIHAYFDLADGHDPSGAGPHRS